MEVDGVSSVVVQSPKATSASKEARQSQGANYMAYLNREPPKHLGERTHPQGSPSCLKGFVVVMTGMMNRHAQLRIRVFCLSKTMYRHAIFQRYLIFLVVCKAVFSTETVLT